MKRRPPTRGPGYRDFVPERRGVQNVRSTRRVPGPVRFIAVVMALLTVVAMAPSLDGQELCPYRYHVETQGQQLSLPYCATAPIDERNDAIERIVFSIHGVATNAETYYANMVRAAEQVPGAMGNTLIIAPQLMTAAYAGTVPIGPTDLFWQSSSERFWGGDSGSTERHPRPVSINSFELFDRLLTDLTDPERFPNLSIIVLAGHSGGGQLTNRYAAANLFEGDPTRERGVHIRYIVANPSTHVYLTPERATSERRTRDEFATPPDHVVAECPDYDAYGSGLDALGEWPYLAAVGAERIRQQFGQRDVVYLNGMNDSDPEGAALARGCAAMLQGAQRLERGITYFNHVEHFYGEGGHRHRISFVPRVAHEHAGIWASEQGLLHIFDFAVTLAERGSADPGRNEQE
jgi:hypothetical protein